MILPLVYAPMSSQEVKRGKFSFPLDMQHWHWKQSFALIINRKKKSETQSYNKLPVTIFLSTITSHLPV